MTPTDPKPRLEPLLQESLWLHSIARGLTHQDADRDDLIQDTWLSALRGRSREADHPRAWLGTAMRRMALRQGRSRRRRQDHEALSHSEGAEALDPEASAERLELASVLASELSKLDEPYRTDLYFRYYEGLAPAAIAARQGISGSTLRGRLHRGRELLRQALVARDGRSWESWAAVLIPLGGAPSVGAAAGGSLTLGTVLTMKMTAAGVLVGALVAGGSWIAETPPGAGSSQGVTPDAVKRPAAEEASAGPGALQEVSQDQADERVAAAAPSSAQDVETDPLFGTIGGGMVTDEEGAPIKDASVSLALRDGSARTARSGESGGWTLLGLAPGAARLEISAPGFITAASSVEIPAAAGWTRSIALQSAAILPVRFEHEDGTAWAMDWAAGGPGASFGVAVTKKRPGPRLDAQGRFIRRSEAARFESRAEDDLPPGWGDDYQGRLLLTAEPPLWVSLTFREAVVESRRLDGSETEILFRIDDLTPFSGTVRLRLVNGKTGEAVTEGLTLSHPAGSRHITPRVEDGEFVFEGVPPGPLRIELFGTQLSGKSIESHGRLEVGPGEVLDLGVVRLPAGGR